MKVKIKRVFASRTWKGKKELYWKENEAIEDVDYEQDIYWEEMSYNKYDKNRESEFNTPFDDLKERYKLLNYGDEFNID